MDSDDDNYSHPGDILLADPDVFGADTQATLSDLITSAWTSGNDDDLYNFRLEFAREMERRMDIRHETWTWFDIDWSKDGDYYDPVED